MSAEAHDNGPPLEELRTDVAAWLRGHAPVLRKPARAGRSFRARLGPLRDLQRSLYDAGWLRHGWPRSVGGLSGGALHRAVVYEELARAGAPDRGPFEHVEILVPPLLRHWTPAELSAAIPPFLRGDVLWCQGFSEPDAGSDLSALRTRARPDGDGYRVDGRKIWTSWATCADCCVVLARTGTLEDRHRGLSLFMVDLREPGVEVAAIRQANGQDELAEVSFDGVYVDRAMRIGDEGDGWQLALEILSYERGASSWLRQALLHARAAELAATGRPAAAPLGDALLDLYALRLSTAAALRAVDAGIVQGPEAALTKLLRTDAEQHLFDLAEWSSDGEHALGSPTDDAVGRWQDEYLFSRAVSIYGGTRQMQLTTIARYVLRIGVGGVGTRP